ncbi:MAG TPA: DUF3108 domain-containing protein [Caldilineaceae bacterium]|nr:DUF3108 domain-containing protein [Caldilineaceae bacterium]
MLLLWLAGCTQPDPQPLIVGETPWQDGERSTFRVTDLNGNYAGTARFDLARLDDQTWNLRREISAQGAQEIVVVDMRLPGLRPTTATLVRIDDSGAEQVRTTYNGSVADLELTNKLDITTYERVNIPSDVRDQRSLLMLLRTLPLAQGYATRLNSFLPVVPLLDRVTISVTDREEVQVPAGSFDAWKVRLDTGDSRTDAWIGVAPPYPLVKFVDGRTQGTFELTEFQPGR